MLLETVAEPARDFSELCGVLYNMAQKHVPAHCFSETSELVNIAKILQANNIAITPVAKLKAAMSDHSTVVAKQTCEYRLLRAKYAAALSTIADLGTRKQRRNKTDFHTGVHEGLRRAAKIAIMFLADIADGKLEPLPSYNKAQVDRRLRR
jgi:hypothetical protein